MTYGWAILVVLAAIAALAYFGVLSPEKFLPEKCILAPGIACVQHKLTPTETTLILSNGFGRTIRVTSLQVGNCGGALGTPVLMQSGTENTFTLNTAPSGGNCDNGLSTDAFKGDITLTYEDVAYNLTKTVHGNIATKVE